MEKFLTQLRKDWMILLFIGTVIMSWTMFSARLTQAEEKISKLESTLESINEIKTNIAVIQNDVSYIKNKVK